MKRACVLIGLCGVALLCTGCGGGRATMAQWQREVESYIASRGRGDPNALRDVVSPPGRPIFSTHGGENPAQSTDVIGLLLGQRPIEGEPATIFLVAVVNKGQVQDVRIAALSRQEDRLRWRIGAADSRALLAYRDHRRSVPQHPPWPAREDAFDLAVTPTAITVTERASGARWTLPLATG